MKIAYLSEELQEILQTGLASCRNSEDKFDLGKISQWVDATHISGAFRSELDTKEELWVQVYWQLSNDLGHAKFFRDVQASHCGEIVRDKEAYAEAKIILQEMKEVVQALEQNVAELDERFPEFNDMFE